MEILLNGKGDVETKRPAGPTGKVKEVFERVARPPRRQRERVIEFVEAFVEHYEQKKRDAVEADYRAKRAAFMPLPEFNSLGELPEGVHQARIEEVVARFGKGTAQREEATRRLLRIYESAKKSGKLVRLVIFGSYITDKAEPNDVDIVLIVSDDFKISECDEETKALFDHARTQEEMGASVFWVRPSMILLENVAEFISHWQIKRDKGQRGIVEVKI